MIIIIKYRLLASNSEKLRFHMRRYFNIWKDQFLSEIQKIHKNQEKIKQLQRFFKFYNYLLFCFIVLFIYYTLLYY